MTGRNRVFHLLAHLKSHPQAANMLLLPTLWRKAAR